MGASPCVVSVLLLLLSGCGLAARPDASSALPAARPARDDEKLAVGRAISPLLDTLDSSGEQAPAVVEPRGDCTVALAIFTSRTINAAIWLGRVEPCVRFGLAVTEGALQTLPPGELMALLAHELAHVRLGHVSAPGAPRHAPLGPLSARDSMSGPALAFADTTEIPAGPRRRFSPADEAEADRLAARVLFRLGQRSACLELATLLDRLAGPGQARDTWLSTHPPLAWRASQARAECDRGAPLARPGGGAVRVDST